MKDQNDAKQLEIAAGQYSKEKDYWINRLAGDLEPTGFPTAYDPGFQERSPAVKLFQVPGELASKLTKLSNQSELRLYIALTAAVTTLIHKYTGREDIMTGAPIFRQTVEGRLINTVLTLRNTAAPDMSFRHLLMQVSQTLYEANENQNYPIETLLYHLNIPYSRDADFPLFDVAVLLENLHAREYLDRVQLKMIFSFTWEKQEGRIQGKVEYDARQYREETIEGIIRHFMELQEAVFRGMDRELRCIDIVTREEKRRLLYEFNDTAAHYPADKTIHRLFEDQARQSPDNIALQGCTAVWPQGGSAAQAGTSPGNQAVLPDQPRPDRPVSLTYRQLNEQSERLARQLKEKGVQPGTIAGIMLERSVEMIIAIMGILKSGGAYMPIEPGYPRERIQYMLKDSGVKILVTVHDLSEKFEKLSIVNCQLLIVNEIPSNRRRLNNPPQEANSINNYQLTINNLQLKTNSLAYIIYTSGTTGKPKGVLAEHRSVVNTVTWYAKYHGLGKGIHVLQTSGYMFDPSVEQIFGTLLHGGVLYLLEKEGLTDIDHIRCCIDKNQVQIIDFVPMMLKQLLGNGPKLRSIKTVISGGDKLEEDVKDIILEKGYELYNHYGPTEITVDALAARCTADPVVLGKPIDNVSCYILGPDEKLMPVGVAGELYIGGSGVARGYINNPGLTAIAFCLRRPGALFEKTAPGPRKNFLLMLPGKDRMQSGNGNQAAMQAALHRLRHSTTPPLHHSPLTFYRTGDRARWLTEGNVQFLGRNDHQVKIRGFRIELGEIENHMRGHPQVKDALVNVVETPTGSGNKSLCAYVTGTPGAGALEIREIKEYLAARLPGYMIPGYFYQVNEIPLTPGGKIDREALPRPGEQETGTIYTPPRDELEKKLVTLWSEVLEINPDIIGIDADFFESGGHSLNAAVLAARIHKELNVKVPMAVLFETPFIRGLARYIRGAAKEKLPAVQKAEEKEYYPLSPAQERLYILQQMEPEATAYNLPVLMVLEGELDKEKLERVFVQLLRRHESFRTSFEMMAGEPVQKIHKNVEFKIKNYNFAAGDTGDTETTGGIESTWTTGTTGGTDAAGTTTTTAGRTTADKIHQFIHSLLRPFDLACSPLLWVVLMKQEEKKHLLAMDMHHIIADGISTAIMVREFMALYEGKELSPLKLRYKDFARWQNDRLTCGEMKNQEEYWKEVYREAIPVLQLPYDNPRPALQSFTGDSIRFQLEPGQKTALQSLARKENATIFVVLLSIYTLVLSRLSGQGDIVVGTPVASRQHAELQGIIGMFVNTMALRNRLEENRPFTVFLNEVKKRTTAAVENQEYPFEMLVEQLTITRDSSRNPLFDVMFSLENMNIPALKIKGLQVEPAEFGSRSAKFDMNLSAVETGDDLLCNIEYCTSLFKKETMERFILYFKETVTAILENPGKNTAEINIIPWEERKRQLYEFNKTSVPYPGEKTIHRLIEEQEERRPDRVALVGPGGSRQTEVGDPGGKAAIGEGALLDPPPLNLTYREINDRSGEMARWLKAKRILPAGIVGIMMERSVEMVIGILGVLKAGGAYMPMDPGYPQERIDYMLKDSDARIILKKPGIRNPIPETNPNDLNSNDRDKKNRVTVLDFEHLNFEFSIGRPRREHSHFEFQASNLSYSSLAYIIYTSGTTGNPKGVMIEHRGMVNHIYAKINDLGLEDRSIVAQNASHMFDISIWQFFAAVVTGGRTVIVPDEIILEPVKLMGFLQGHRVTVLEVVPSYLAALLEIPAEEYAKTAPIHLQYLVVTGEAVNPGLIKRWFLKYPGNKVVNAYGPTEAADDITHYIMDKAPGMGLVPLGTPVQNMQIYIVDKYMNLCPIGVTGELLVTGVGVGRGYLNRPGLTAEKFDHDLKAVSFGQVENAPGEVGSRAYKIPFNNFNKKFLEVSEPFFKKVLTRRRQRLYKTGDLARWLPDGKIEFQGRIDNQVKIRGYRIEMGEIESRLSAHESVKEAVLIDKTTRAGEKYLCAYVVFRDPDAAAGKELKSYLSQHLPDYMVPAQIVELERMPLSPNGKVDRKALPEPGAKPGREYVAPDTDKEREIAEIWKQVLDLEKVSIDENFFDAGGNSIKIIKLAMELKKRQGIEIPAAKMFQYTTISSQARYIVRTEAEKSREVEVDFEVEKVKNKLKQRQKKIRS